MLLQLSLSSSSSSTSPEKIWDEEKADSSYGSGGMNLNKMAKHRRELKILFGFIGRVGNMDSGLQISCTVDQKM